MISLLNVVSLTISLMMSLMLDGRAFSVRRTVLAPAEQSKERAAGAGGERHEQRCGR